MILLASPMSAALTAAIGSRYPLIGAPADPLDIAIAGMPAATLAGIRALVALGVERIDAALLARMPALGLISCLGSGYEAIDVAAAAARGVAVTHSPGASAASVADLALGLIIECVRDIPRKRAHLHAGEWNGMRGARPVARPGLTGRNLGIFGLGAIGRKIAVRALACEMHVAYYGRQRQSDAAYPFFDSLPELAAWADVLVVSARARTDNRHAVDAAVLSALGPDGYLVNVGRGSLVDEAALIAALEQGRIAGAGLDVFEHEPQVPAALRALPNVALTPHIGGVAQDARQASEQMLLANLDAFFAGKPLPTPVRAET